MSNAVARGAGGPGSGNFGHGGRPGQVGGSSSDEGGEGGAAASDKREAIKWDQPTDKSGRPIPIKTKDIDEAIALVHQGKVVEVPDIKTAHTLIDKLAQMADEAKKAGKEAKEYDLCQVSVPNTNMFCNESLRAVTVGGVHYPDGIPRLEMPQLGGEPVPGSDADKLPKKEGKVDASAQFIDHLKSIGLKTDPESVPASSLKASQRELIGTKVGGMMNARGYDPGKVPVFVSSDGYVIDGHHRWAAVVGRDAEDGNLGDSKMNIIRVNAPISEVLHISNEWSKKFGIKQVGGPGKKARAAMAYGYTDAEAKEFRALVASADLSVLEDEPTNDKDEHPFTYCMETVIPAMEKDGKGPSDPKKFCGWWKAEHKAAMDINVTQARAVHLVGATGQIRTGQHEGREHVIVPVVALMEGVIHAINAETPEYVPISCLACAPQGWNGRPIVLGHPARNGRQISANEPEVLASKAFGTVFGAQIRDKKLVMEAWIDVDKAQRVGAGRLLERIQNNDMVEVSVGAFVVTEDKSGMHGDRHYKAIWKDIVPDHLAFLPQGVGACSNTMGCGTPRMAAAHYLIGKDGIVEVCDNERNKLLGVSKIQALKAKVQGLVERVRAASNPEGINQYTKGGGGGKSDTKDGKSQRKAGDFATPEEAKAGRSAGKTVLSGEKPEAVEAFLDAIVEGENDLRDWTPKQIKEEYHAWVTGSRDDHDFIDENHEMASDAPSKKLTAKEMLREDAERVKEGKAPIHKEALTEAYRKVARNRKPTMREAAGAYDTPEQVASEEAAELIGYETMLTICEQIGEVYVEVVSTLKDLISAEKRGAADEQAETELEAAQLESIRVLCLTMFNALSTVMTAASDMMMRSGYNNTYPLPMASSPSCCAACGHEDEHSNGECLSKDCKCQEKTENRAAAGARHSASDRKMIQDVHDYSVTLGAECHEPKALEEKMTNVQKAAAKIKASSDGKYTVDMAVKEYDLSDAEATELRQQSKLKTEEETRMTKEQRSETITGLCADKHSGFTTADSKMLEAASDERLEQFRVAAAARKTEVEAKEKKEPEPKAAAAATASVATTVELKTLSEEDFMKIAPDSIKTLIAEKKEQDTATKADLVSKLKAAQSEYSESELAAMDLKSLQRFARVAGVDTPPATFEGRGMPRDLATDKDVYRNPPDPYAPALKVLAEHNAALAPSH